jgi:GDP-4-dehydro-6-deoxy-D-mannose reductase
VGPAAKKRVLVTGASGFVGAALLPALRAAYPEARILGTSSSADSAGFGAADIETTSLDLLSDDSVRSLVSAFKPTDVVHLAAQSSVQGAFSSPLDVWRTNVVGVIRLAEALRAVSPEALIMFASSGEAYGRSFQSGQALTEDAPLQPENPYARSKAAAEMALQDLWGDTGRLVILRMFNHLGPGQDERFVAASFAAQVARAEKGTGPATIKVGDLSAERDFGDIRDLVRAYMRILDRAEALAPRSVFNVCSGTTRPVREIAELLVELARVRIAFEVDPARVRPQNLPRAAGSPAALTAVTGWRPVESFRDTIAATLDYWRGNV